MVQDLPIKANSCLTNKKNYLHFHYCRGTILTFTKFVGTHSQRAELTLTATYFFGTHFVFSARRCVGLPNALFPRGLPNKILYPHYVSCLPRPIWRCKDKQHTPTEVPKETDLESLNTTVTGFVLRDCNLFPAWVLFFSQPHSDRL